MMNANNRSWANRTWAWPLVVALAALTACDGRTKVGQLGQDGQNPRLVSVEIGRLVDIYSYQRIDPSQGDRRLRENRRIELVAKNVVVNAQITTQSLFDAAGNAVATADYEFLPFDKAVGHEQLLILWDDRDSTDNPEKASFDAALQAAQSGLSQLPAAYRNQNTQTRPIPIVARNAAIKLNFSGPINVDESFFTANPAAVQLLEFKGDPDIVGAANAFRILPYRVVTGERSVVLDTTILAGEADGGITSPGMPLSSDNVTANIRIAIPTRGSVLRSFYIDADEVAELNGLDSAGRDSVIRDFRSGNLLDGQAGRLTEPEAPQLVGSMAMGIIDVDVANNRIQINKRGIEVPVRGRYPFVEGGKRANGVPAGPLGVPTQRPLAHGDIIEQELVVPLSDGTFENVTLRAEVLLNEAIVAVDGDQNNGRPDPGITLAGNDSGQGETIPTVWVKVAPIGPLTNSEGAPIWFTNGGSTTVGADCTLRTSYVENVPFSSGGGQLSDSGWRGLFLRIEPNTGVTGQDVDPNATIALEFTKPMDLDQVDNSANYLVTNMSVALETFTEQMSDPKRATTRIVPTRLTDLNGDGTVLRLQPPMGFAHQAGQAETYCVHVRLGSGGVTDLAGQGLEIYGDIANPLDAWSVDFTLDPAANSNLVGWKIYAFEAEDEDGSLPGSVDMFGQFRLENGRLYGASGVRFSRSANNNNLSTISRIARGECWDSGDPADPVDNPFGYIGTPNTPNQTIAPAPGPPLGVVPVDANGAPHPGLLYWEPRMSDQVTPPNVPQVYEYYQTQPQNTGRVIEPLKPQGSRVQMRYIEDDFSLSYTQPSEFALDVEQLYWSPSNDETILYDHFDRVSMSLGHARTRPDERWLLILDPADPTVSWCVMDCASMNSSLSTTFSENVLEGSSQTTVFEDEVYTINPNEVFRDGDNVAYVPYPRFDRSYTWRDSRLITVDGNGNVIGLGGAQNPTANVPNDDTTANIDSPWIVSQPDPEFAQFGSGVWCQDPADFVGTNQRDHDPIALPLLVDIKVFPDDPANVLAQGVNAFQMALLGSPTNFAAGNPGGYYDAIPSGCGGLYPAWSRLRVQASGGWDLISGAEILLDPANALTANQQNIIKDAAAGLLGGSTVTALFSTGPGDGMLYWARADFVRKVSTVTFGFFDTLQPQRAEIVDQNQSVIAENGFPDWLTVNPLLRMTDVVVQVDPPQTRQPAGTGVVVELRGCETFTNSSRLYNPVFGSTADDAFDTRGNLLNANYACEAYRYSTANVAAAPRIAASGLTRYVTEDQLSEIRDPATGLLPRFLNPRLVMTNNVDVSPALSPSLRSMSIVYRLAPGQ
ncbi:MAG TPA: hypothetical protein ENI87_06765 [bacterium]|nr:hypothetical protein [bacterium]